MVSIEAASEDKATCAICRRQVSRYTCPACNISYCSLVCFRAEAHVQCSEGFYKRELESEIRTQPSASHEERRKMMGLLKKFEEEDGNSTLEDVIDDEGDEDDTDDVGDLAKKLADVDIENLSPDELWGMLSQGQRDSFLKITRSKDSAAAQDLLRSLDLDEGVTLPWWERPEGEYDDEDVPTVRKRYGKRPSFASLPDALLRQPPGPQTGPPLLYNICVVFMAYAYTTRHLSMSPLSSPDNTEDLSHARQEIRELAPFITDRRARTLFRSMDEVVADVWPRLVSTDRIDRVAFVALLRDAARLLSPRRIAEMDKVIEVPCSADKSVAPTRDLRSHALRDAFHALSDLVSLFMQRDSSGAGSKDSPASAKLRFYISHLIALPSALMAGFSAEVAARARQIEEEGAAEVKTYEAQSHHSGVRPKEKAMIKEL